MRCADVPQAVAGPPVARVRVRALVPRSTWSLLLPLGIVYKREAIEEMLLDIGEERMKWPQRGSQSIGF